MQCAADYALADPTRRELFERPTRDGEQTVHALTDRAGVSQPMVSKHLAALKRARLVNNRRSGRETHYSAQTQALAPLFDWMRLYGTVARDQYREVASRTIEDPFTLAVGSEKYGIAPNAVTGIRPAKKSTTKTAATIPEFGPRKRTGVSRTASVIAFPLGFSWITAKFAIMDMSSCSRWWQ